jgi:hypothetical protein
MHQIVNTLKDLDECTGTSMEKFNEIVKFHKENHEEELDYVAILYQIVGITNNKLHVFYELTCGLSTVEYCGPDDDKPYHCKDSTAGRYCTTRIKTRILAHMMIKPSQFNKIMQQFTYPLCSAYRADANEDSTYEFHNIESMTATDPFDIAGFIIKFTDKFAVAALEEGRNLQSINTLYKMVSELQKHSRIET